jgi:hypothetical protein
MQEAYYFGNIKQRMFNQNNIKMKKLGSIAAIALMAFGLVTYVAENTASEFDFMSDLNTMLACSNCSTSSNDRPPPKTLA